VWVGSHDGHMHIISSLGDAVAKFQTGGAVFSSPIKNEDSGITYFGSQDGYVYAISSQMLLKWKTLLGAPIFSSPNICPNTGIIFCGCCNGLMFALSPNGEKLWTFQTSKPIYSSPCLLHIHPPVILFGSHDGFIYCLARQTGDLIWKLPVKFLEDEKTESMVYSSSAYILLKDIPQQNESIKIVVCNTNGSVYLLKWEIGKKSVEIEGTLQLPKAVFSSLAWINQSQFVVGCRDNYLYCINTNHITYFYFTSGGEALMRSILLTRYFSFLIS